MGLGEVIDFNLTMCHSNDRKYPLTKTFSKDVIDNTLGIDDTTIVLDHWDKEKYTDKQFYHQAYHYQRKNRYWRCKVG